MTVKRVFLIIRADQKVRAVGRMPSLRPDEIAIPIDLRFPQGWGEVRWGIGQTIDVPDFQPAASVDVDGILQGAEEEGQRDGE